MVDERQEVHCAGLAKGCQKMVCKENGLSYSEMDSMTDICHDMLSKVKGAQDEANHD